MDLSEWRKMLAAFIGFVAIACPICMADIITYTVKKGDSLWRIAQRHRTSVVFLRRLNALQNDALKVGQELRVCTGPVKIVVDKSECMMWIYSGQDVLAEFSVAVGKPGKTPSGTYTVKTKLVNPEWTHPETKEVIKFGDPRHEIGTRWLGIGEGLGIHGTNDPDSIGKPVSSGCIRMRNEEIESVFWAIPRGTVVEIQD
ncbi:MAG: L,D-transpeptidase family protein [Planctomycetota bacterium]